MRWLRSNLSNPFRIILRAGGPLMSRFAELAEVMVTSDANFQESYLEDVTLIYSNTMTNGTFFKKLPYGKIPVLTHVHEMNQTISRQGSANIREIQRHTSHFLACSNAVASDLKKYYQVEPGLLSVVPEAIFPSEVESASKTRDLREIRNSLGVQENELLVLGCGTVGLVKGADLFVQLAKYCSIRTGRTDRRVKFVWMGATPGNPFSEMIRNDFERLGDSTNLCMAGEWENPYPLIRACDLFCLCSREDSFPLVMLEAGALGKPTLAFEGSGGAEEYCGNKGGFVVPYLDVCSMGDWILDHRSDNPLLAASGQKAQELVQEKYSIDSTGPQIAALVRRLSKKRSSPAVGITQLFIPTQKGYSEKDSIRLQIKNHGWNELEFDFEARESCNGWTLRVDPIDRPALMEIARIALFSKTRGLLWEGHANSPGQFDAIVVSGSAIRLPDPKILRLLSLKSDPAIYLPPLRVNSGEEELHLELRMRVGDSHKAMIKNWQSIVQVHRTCMDLSQKYDDTSKQKNGQREDLRLALVYARAFEIGRRLYIWGTGSGGRHAAAVLARNGFRLSGFLEGDAKLAGGTLLGHSILDPEVLKKYKKSKPFIIIGSKFIRQISGRLRKLGYRRGVDFAPFPFL